MVKIVEETERNCCDDRKDFKPYQGKGRKGFPKASTDLKFCQHCGQIWYLMNREDSHGGPYWKEVKLDDNY